MTRLGSSLIKAMRQAAEGEKVNILYIGEAVKENATAKWAYNFHASGTVPYVEKSALDQSQARIKELEAKERLHQTIVESLQRAQKVTVEQLEADLKAAKETGLKNANLYSKYYSQLLQSQRELEACKQMLEARKAACTCDILGPQLTALEAENKRLRDALDKISKVKYGLEGNESKGFLADYWAKRALEYEQIARAALNPTKGE
jgi:predicted DNA binding CopG/RHH family protein